MERICNKNDCTGCHACLNICPRGCISMEYDEEGVLLPHIDAEKCIDCKACQHVCPVNQPVVKIESTKAYATWHKDPDVRKKSASGGVSMAFYETVLENGGVCFGTKFDEDRKLKILYTETKEGAHQFKGSKYAQAYVGDSLLEVKKFLQEGRRVIYIGTPCQIAGLKNYLKRDYDNLITVDLICHGTPSQKFLMEHVEALEAKINQKADNIAFRDGYNYEMGLYKDGQKIYKKERLLDPYLVGFTNGLFMRPNCYHCEYACSERVSDITVGDFWGLGKEKPCSYELGEGISLVLPHSPKGYCFFEEASSKLFVDERPVSEAIHGNSQLMYPSERNVKSQEFLEMYRTAGFEKSAWEYTKVEIQNNQKNLKNYFLKKCIRKIKKLVKHERMKSR